MLRLFFGDVYSRNVRFGTSLPRLFLISCLTYNISIDSDNLYQAWQCYQQTILVLFNGKRLYIMIF